MKGIATSIYFFFLIHSAAFAQTVYADRIFTCGDYYWDKSDITYETSGVYTVASTGENGEDITYELALTIDDSYARSSGTGSCSEYQWYELETPIDWEANSVDMNGAGTIVALGNYFVGDGGEVKVYEWSTSGWAQMGSTLEANAAGDLFGYDVSLSKNGMYLAIGAPSSTTTGGNSGEVQVYEWNGTDWQTRGSLIESIHIYDELGRALDFNNDGSVLAIGAPACGRINTQLGEVRVYEWTGSEYEQFGESLYVDTGDAIPDNNGTSIALSGDGYSVIFGAQFALNSLYNLLGGSYLIYDWDGSEWMQREVFTGYRSGMQLGFSVTMSDDGQYYASGAMGDRGNAGIIFGNQGVLGEIFSSTSGDQMGRSVSMNAEGNIMAVGSASNSTVEFSSGKVQVYRFDGEAWSQMGQDLFGTLEFEFLGYQTQLNDTGNVMAVETFGGSTSTVENVHIYYYGCADAMSSCPTSVIWENDAWSNVDGPSDDDVVYINDDFTLNSDLNPGTLTIAEGAELVVQSGSTLNVNGDLTINGSLTIASGGSFISYQDNSTEGMVTFKRNTRYSDYRYSFVGSPIKDLRDKSASLFAPIVYQYNEYSPYEEDGLGRWADASETRPFEGRGFAAAGQQEITITGIPNSGEISTYGYYTEDATTTSENWGWNLISNPYGAALDLDKFLEGNENIKGFVALWDDHGSNTSRGDNEDYLIVNGIGSVGGPNGGTFDGYIGTMQGFFIQMDGVASRVYFNEDMRLSGNNGDDTFFRKKEDEIPTIRLTISSENEKYSETLIGFPEDATIGLDRRYDATKIKSQSDFNISTVLEGNTLAIQGLPWPTGQTIIPLKFDMIQSESVSFNCIKDNWVETSELILLDQLTGLETALHVDQTTSMQLDSGRGITRYSLVIRTSTSILNVDPEITSVVITRSDENGIRVTSNSKNIQRVAMWSMMGRSVYDEIELGQSVLLPNPNSKGLFIISIQTEDGSWAQNKIIIR